MATRKTRKSAPAPSVIERAQLLYQGDDLPTRKDIKLWTTMLEGNAEIDAGVRTRIAEALHYLADILKIDADEKQRKRTRRSADATWKDALVAVWLVTDKSVSVETAVQCAIGKGTAERAGRVKRAYQKIQNGTFGIPPPRPAASAYYAAVRRIPQSSKKRNK